MMPPAASLESAYLTEKITVASMQCFGGLVITGELWLVFLFIFDHREDIKKLVSSVLSSPTMTDRTLVRFLKYGAFSLEFCI